MIIGNFRYEPGADTYTGELRTLTMQRKGVVLRPLRKGGEREPDYRVVEVTEAGAVELGAAWRKRTKRGRDYLSVLLDDPALHQPMSAALFLGEDDQHATLVWSRPAPRPPAQPDATPKAGATRAAPRRARVRDRGGEDGGRRMQDDRARRLRSRWPSGRRCARPCCGVGRRAGR